MVESRKGIWVPEHVMGPGILTVNDTAPMYSRSDMMKAVQDAQLQSESEARKRITEAAMMQDVKSTLIDPNNILNYVGTRAKPNTVGASVLRAMAVRCKPVAAILKTRLNQMSKFARRPRHEHDTGFKIVLKETDRKMNSAEKKRAFEIEEMILRTGTRPNAMRKDNFDQFTRKVIRDSLTLDALTWENVFTRGGGFAEMWAMDAATIELVIDQRFGPEYPVYVPETKKALGDAGHIAYVQKINGQTYAEYTEEELAYGIRNPRTDIDSTLFGLSELEELVETVTNILNAEKYNGSYFNESHLPMGVLNVVGNYDDEVMEAFKRNWENLTSGVVGKWKVPVIASSDGQGVSFVPFKQNSKDMEYHQWMSFLTTIACAIYQIDPAEIGFESYQPNGKSSLSGDDTDAKLTNSKDKGLEPLALFYESQINSEVIDRIDPNFVIRFVGVSEEDEAKKWDLMTKKLEAGYSTVYLERKANDDPDIIDPKTGEVAEWTMLPANQVLSTYVANQQQAQAQQDAAQDQHFNSMEQLAGQHAMNLHAADQNAQIAEQQAENDHGRAMEQGAMQGVQQQQLQGQKMEHDKQLQSMEHAHQSMQAMGQQQGALQMENVKHENAKALAEQQGQQQVRQLGVQHQNAMAQQQAQQSHEAQMGQTQHGNEMKKMGLQHGLDMRKQNSAQEFEASQKTGDRTHDLRKMGLQHGLDSKAQSRKHNQSMEQAAHQHELNTQMTELQAALAALSQLSQSLEDGENGGGTTRKASKGSVGRGKKLRKSLSSDLSDTRERTFRGEDQIVVVINVAE